MDGLRGAKIISSNRDQDGQELLRRISSDSFLSFCGHFRLPAEELSKALKGTNSFGNRWLIPMEQRPESRSWASTILVYLSAPTAFLRINLQEHFNAVVYDLSGTPPVTSNAKVGSTIWSTTDEVRSSLISAKTTVSMVSSSMSSFANTKRSSDLGISVVIPAARKWLKPGGLLRK